MWYIFTIKVPHALCTHQAAHSHGLLQAPPVDAILGEGIDTPEGSEQLPAREARVTAYLMEAFAAGTEGLMLKALDGPGAGYQPSRRSESWLKIKKCVLAVVCLGDGEGVLADQVAGEHASTARSAGLSTELKHE